MITPCYPQLLSHFFLSFFISLHSFKSKILQEVVFTCGLPQYLCSSQHSILRVWSTALHRKSILFYNIRALCLAQTNSRFSVTIFLKCQEHLTHLSFSYFDFQDITFCCLSPYYIGLPRAFNSPRLYMLEHRDSALFSLSILIS